MWQEVPPLLLEAIFFWKSTFRLCRLDYKNLTIDVVKWPPPLQQPPPMLLEAKYFLKSTFKLCNIRYKTLNNQCFQMAPLPPLVAPTCLLRQKTFQILTFKLCSLDYKNLATNEVKWHPFTLATIGKKFFEINLYTVQFRL